MSDIFSIFASQSCANFLEKFISDTFFMLIIQDILVSDEVVEQQFVCNLNACKGACCWEGDFGAPLEAAELPILREIYAAVEPYLGEESKAVIEAQGKYTRFGKDREYGTPLVANGACAYMTFDELNIARCGIEQAWRARKTTFRKPISCHLYPIRVSKHPAGVFEALNYDRWDICSAACELGVKEEMPVYQFLKEPLIRKYGEDFYDELDAAAQYFLATK